MDTRSRLLKIASLTFIATVLANAPSPASAQQQAPPSEAAAAAATDVNSTASPATQSISTTSPSAQRPSPTREEIQAALTKAYQTYKGLQEGKNADYIPALAKVPSDLFGIALITLDGTTYTIGDVGKEFSIQSISKVFTLAKVMQEKGDEIVKEKVGVDATGQPFNSIVAVEKEKGADQNPLVNPGAIATTSMIKGNTPEEKWAKIIGIHSDFAGRPLAVNQEVYKSESETNQRNQAIGMLMKAYERLEGDPKIATDLYTRQCSINVNARDLATMAATLANGGVNPVTQKKVIDQAHVDGILAVMATAGLYDTSGQWLFNTGLPAKSGVGGGLIAVSPGKWGIAVFSPRLDEAGNSVRAQKAIADISKSLGGNPYDVKPVVAQSSGM